MITKDWKEEFEELTLLELGIDKWNVINSKEVKPTQVLAFIESLLATQRAETTKRIEKILELDGGHCGVRGKLEELIQDLSHSL